MWDAYTFPGFRPEGTVRFEDGAAYERMMGTWSRLASEIFLDWLAPRSGLDPAGAMITVLGVFAGSLASWSMCSVLALLTA